jgi:hypothetical protein
MKQHTAAVKEYDATLLKHIGRKDIIKVFRKFRSGDSDMVGIPLDISDQFLLMQEEYDFSLDGYVIVPKDKFDSIRCAKFERASKKILKAEGILGANNGIQYSVGISSWEALFRSLKKNDQHVIIECEDLDESTFTIGPIVRVNKKSVSVLYFDATGQLNDAPTTIPFEDITIVKFDTRYNNIFRKYLKPAK